MDEIPEPGLGQALEALHLALEEADVRYMIVGGIAVIAHGVPRQTVDLDATVWAEGLEIDALLDRLRAHEIVPRIDGAGEFARRHQVLLLVHTPSSTPLDVSLAWLPFEKDALESAQDMQLAGVEVPVVRVEDLILYKAVAWRDRDRADIERLLAIHAVAVDLERVRRLLADFATVLEEPERLAAFDALVARVLEGG